VSLDGFPGVANLDLLVDENRGLRGRAFFKLSDLGRSADATALLQPVYGRFTEGFATADLKATKALLDDLSELEKFATA